MNITTLKATSKDVTAVVATTSTANLGEPEFRRGKSYVRYHLTAGENIQDADVRGLASAHLSFPGTNSILESVWYGQWASMATDEAAMTSSLCAINESSQTNDACPFLPIMRTSDNSTPESWLMKLIYSLS